MFRALGINECLKKMCTFFLQFPMHIALPSPSPEEEGSNNNPGTFIFDQDSLERASNKSSTSYDASHNTETLPATQKTMTTTA